jgi:hypothetical protein
MRDSREVATIGEKVSDRDDWLDCLRSARRDEALAELRRILVHGLKRALAPRGGGEAFAEDVAQEALLRILASLLRRPVKSPSSTRAKSIVIRSWVGARTPKSRKPGRALRPGRLCIPAKLLRVSVKDHHRKDRKGGPLRTRRQGKSRLFSAEPFRYKPGGWFRALGDISHGRRA